MIEQIGTAPVEVALLGAFTLILWDFLRGRRRGWLRVMAVVVAAPACALAATVISAGVGWTVAVPLEPDEPPPPAHTEQTTPENRERGLRPPKVGTPRRPPSGVRPPLPRLRHHPGLRLHPRLRPHLRPSNVRVVRQCDEHPSRITCTLGGSGPSSCPYSLEYVEGKFSEVHIQKAAWPRSYRSLPAVLRTSAPTRAGLSLAQPQSPRRLRGG